MVSFLAVVSVCESVDWEQMYSSYSACLSWVNMPSGTQKYLDMSTAFNEDVLPSCSSDCMDDPNLVTSYGHFCTKNHKPILKSVHDSVGLVAAMLLPGSQHDGEPAMLPSLN